MKLRKEQTELHTWFERDRAHVELRSKLTNQTVVEWWDDDVQQTIEDGYLDPKDFHQSAYAYAEQMGLLPVDRLNVASAYRKAVSAFPAEIHGALATAEHFNRIVRRVRYHYNRNRQEPGDCKGDEKLLLALAIAQENITKGAGWIPAVQMLAVKIAKVI